MIKNVEIVVKLKQPIFIVFQEMTVVKQIVQVNQTVTIKEFVMSYTTHQFVRTVTQAGWDLLVMMYVFTEHPTPTIQSVTVTKSVTMEKDVI